MWYCQFGLYSSVTWHWWCLVWNLCGSLTYSRIGACDLREMTASLSPHRQERDRTHKNRHRSRENKSARNRLTPVRLDWRRLKGVTSLLIQMGCCSEIQEICCLSSPGCSALSLEEQAQADFCTWKESGTRRLLLFQMLCLALVRHQGPWSICPPLTS